MSAPLCEAEGCEAAVDYQLTVDGASVYCRDCASDMELLFDWRPRRPHSGLASFTLSIGEADMVERYGTLRAGRADFDDEYIPGSHTCDPINEASMRIAQASLLGWELVSVSESNGRIYLWFRPERKR